MEGHPAAPGMVVGLLLAGGVGLPLAAAAGAGVGPVAGAIANVSNSSRR